MAFPVLALSQAPKFGDQNGFVIAGVVRALCAILVLFCVSCSIPVTGSITETPRGSGRGVSGYLFNGSIHPGLFGDRLELNNYMYSNIGADRVACWGPFRPPTVGDKFKVLLKCSDGRYGTAIVTLDHSSHAVGYASYVTLDKGARYSGSGGFTLNDYSSGWFWFGEMRVSSCGCGPMPVSGLAPGSEPDFVANVGDRVFFASASAQLSPDAKQTLGRQAAWLAHFPSVDIVIRGFTDPRGSIAYNAGLAKKRAASVRSFLIMQGVATSRISLLESENQPIVVRGSNNSAYQQDRTAVIWVAGSEPPTMP